jgi:hypothetical protein
MNETRIKCLELAVQAAAADRAAGFGSDIIDLAGKMLAFAEGAPPQNDPIAASGRDKFHFTSARAAFVAARDKPMRLLQKVFINALNEAYDWSDIRDLCSRLKMSTQISKDDADALRLEAYRRCVSLDLSVTPYTHPAFFELWRLQATPEESAAAEDTLRAKGLWRPEW